MTDVVYATDPGFARPTLAAIARLRQVTTGPPPPVHVLGVGFAEREQDSFRRLSEAHQVNFIPGEIDRLREFTNERFNKTHVPPTALARFFLGDHVAAASERQVLYLDGDTLLQCCPRPLLDLNIPTGQMLMSEDQSFYYQFDQGPTGRSVRRYFSQIGIEGHRGYGNSGVILSSWQTWRDVSSDALQFLRENLQYCRYHDQSAINAVIGHRRVRLSARWNYQISFRNWGIDSFAPPKQLHFAGGEKPWKGRLRSLARFHDLYEDLLRDVGTQDFPKQLWSQAERRQIERINLTQRIKNATLLWGRMQRRRRLFARTEAEALIP